jgi:hypothetical protein
MNGTPLITAIRGPVMLITLGLLFMTDQFGSFSFTRTWPVLIIVFGVLKLLEHAAGSREPASPGM